MIVLGVMAMQFVEATWSLMNCLGELSNGTAALGIDQARMPSPAVAASSLMTVAGAGCY